MPLFSGSMVPPPSSWRDFEALCCDLWRQIWQDSSTQRHGRSGQPQCGVDVYGRPFRSCSFAGIQCKGKSNYLDSVLTIQEIEAEVEKARMFEPPLSEFIIVTTGHKDIKVEKRARAITTKHLSEGFFAVTVLGWEDLLLLLEDHPDVIAKHYPWIAPPNENRRRIILDFAFYWSFLVWSGSEGHSLMGDYPLNLMIKNVLALATQLGYLSEDFLNPTSQEDMNAINNYVIDITEESQELGDFYMIGGILSLLVATQVKDHKELSTLLLQQLRHRLINVGATIQDIDKVYDEMEDALTSPRTESTRAEKIFLAFETAQVLAVRADKKV